MTAVLVPSHAYADLWLTHSARVATLAFRARQRWARGES